MGVHFFFFFVQLRLTVSIQSPQRRTAGENGMGGYGLKALWESEEKVVEEMAFQMWMVEA